MPKNKNTKITPFNTITQNVPVYVVLGVDENEHDQVLQLFYKFDDAKEYCKEVMKGDFLFYDLWIETHVVA